MPGRPAITEASITERYLQSWQHRLTVGFSITEDLLIFTQATSFQMSAGKCTRSARRSCRAVGCFSGKCKLALLSEHGEASLFITTCRRLVKRGYRAALRVRRCD